PVPTNEIAPCRIPSSLRRWPKAVSLEDVAHRLIADVVPQIVDRASNSVVAPRRIVSGQMDDEVFDFGLGRRSSVLFAKSRTIELLGHQSPVPFEDRLGFDDGNRVRHQFTESDGFLGEDASLVVGQENTAVDLIA